MVWSVFKWWTWCDNNPCLIICFVLSNFLSWSPFLCSAHRRAVPAAPGAVGPHAETAGAEPVTCQQSHNNHHNHHHQQHTGQWWWWWWLWLWWWRGSHDCKIVVKLDVIVKRNVIFFCLFVLCPGDCVQDVGPGQCSVCCFGPHHHRPAAGLQVQRGPGGHQWTERGPDRCWSVGLSNC